MSDNQTFKLAKIFMPAFTELNLINYGADGETNMSTVRRSAVFSRMFSVDEKDFDRCERLVFSHDNDVYMYETENGKFAFTLNENGNEYVNSGNYNDFTSSQTYEEVMKKVRREIAKHKLSGRKTPNIADSIFQDNDNIEVIVQNGDNKYQCEKHENYIRPIVKLYIPIKNGDSYKLEEIPYSNTIYRITEHPSRTSYISIPKGFPYMYENICSDDETYGAVEVWKDGKMLVKVDHMENMTEDDKNVIASIAVEADAYNPIDFNDKNTEFFMSFTGVEEAVEG